MIERNEKKKKKIKRCDNDTASGYDSGQLFDFDAEELCCFLQGFLILKDEPNN